MAIVSFGNRIAALLVLSLMSSAGFLHAFDFTPPVGVIDMDALRSYRVGYFSWSGECRSAADGSWYEVMDSNAYTLTTPDPSQNSTGGWNSPNPTIGCNMVKAGAYTCNVTVTYSTWVRYVKTWDASGNPIYDYKKSGTSTRNGSAALTASNQFSVTATGRFEQDDVANVRYAELTSLAVNPIGMRLFTWQCISSPVGGYAIGTYVAESYHYSSENTDIAQVVLPVPGSYTFHLVADDSYGEGPRTADVTVVAPINLSVAVAPQFVQDDVNGWRYASLPMVYHGACGTRYFHWSCLQSPNNVIAPGAVVADGYFYASTNFAEAQVALPIPGQYLLKLDATDSWGQTYTTQASVVAPNNLTVSVDASFVQDDVISWRYASLPMTFQNACGPRYYSWVCLSSPSDVLAPGSVVATGSFPANLQDFEVQIATPKPGDYIFLLVASDAWGQTYTTVVDVEATNDLTVDGTGVFANETALLDATVSKACGYRYYQWECIASPNGIVPSGVIQSDFSYPNQNLSHLDFPLPLPGNYTFQVTASDSWLQGPARVQIDVYYPPSLPSPSCCSGRSYAGTGPCPEGQVSTGHSLIDNFYLSFQHTATDFVARPSDSGCATCSGGASTANGSLPSVRLDRVHNRFTRAGWFGWGATLMVDKRVSLTGKVVQLDDPAYVEVQSIAAIHSKKGKDRIEPFSDQRSRSLALTDDAGNPVDAISAAGRFTLEGWDHRTYTFELGPTAQDRSRGRLLSIREASGATTVVAWQYTRTALTGDAAALAKWYVPQKLTAADGSFVQFTPVATSQGGLLPIATASLPNGQSITYSYGNLGSIAGGLTGIVSSDGMSAQFGMSTLPTGGPVYAINDPFAEVGHQQKSVEFHGSTWIDPWWSEGNPWLISDINSWRVLQVTNGAGELSYRNIRMVVGEEKWSISDSHGLVQRLVSDRKGRIVRTDRIAGSVDWASDPASWPWENLVTYMQNTNLNRITRATYQSGQTTEYLLATNGQSLGRTFTDGLQEVEERSPLGYLLKRTDKIGRISQWTYDADGNQASLRRACGTPAESLEAWTYNSKGLPLSYTDARGNVTDYAYDAAGRLLTETQPPDNVGGARGVTTRAYDAAGRLASITDPLSRKTTYTYDSRNRLTKTTYADTTTETVTYGIGANAGRVVSRTDRRGGVVTYGYDGAGRRILASQVVKRADNTTETLTETCTYIPGSEREASCTRNGETTVYAYDGLGRRISASVYATQSNVLVTSWVYDIGDHQIQETDPYGRRTFWVYDSLDRVIRTVREAVPGAVQSAGVAASMARDASANPSFAVEDTAYDAEGQVASRTDARGTVTAYVYDAQGRLVRQIVAQGTPVEATTAFGYDAAGNQTRIDYPRTVTESAVFATVKTYTGRNLVKSVTEAFGRAEAATSSFVYALDGRVATTTDPLNRVTANTYSSCCGRLTQVQDPLGFLTTYTYDGNGNVLTSVDGNNLTTTMTYDARDRPLKRTDPLGKVWTYTYDDNLLDGAGLDTAAKYATQLAGLGFGRDGVTGYGADGSAVAVLDPNGNETVTVYDGAGRVVRTINALKKSTTTLYDQLVTDATSGAVLVSTLRTDALGATTAQWSDGLGRVQVQVDALGKQVRMTYDGGGNRLSVLDADGVGETSTYDALGRKATCSNAGSGSVTYQYDAAGNLVRTTDAQGGIEIATFDARNRKVYQEDRVGAQTRFTFDKVGNLLTITDGQNGVTTYAYDGRNLLLTEVFPGSTGGTRTYTYDNGRRLKTRKDQTNLITTYVYDNANHLTARQYPDSLNDAFTYDAGGRLLTAVSGRYGTTITRTYDKANRVLTEKLALGTENWTNTGVYNDTGLLTKLTLPDGTAQDRGYSTRSELNSVKLGGTTVATRTYTNAGRLATTVSANGKTETRTYTAAGDGLVEKIAIPSVTDFTYTYDSLKRKTAEIDLITPSNTQNFSYDAANRLVGWNRVTGTAGPVQAQQTWNLSLVGDWTSTTRDGVVENRTHTPVHEVSTVGAATLLYDAKGNLTKDQQAQTFTWDVENRLASAAALVQQSGQTSATYLYDALGRRVRKTVGQNETTWVSWGAQEVYELARNPTAIAADQPPTTPTGGGATPVSGGSTYPSGALLADAAALRITFQPAAAISPAGWLADTGAMYGVRSGATSFGWVGAALNQTVDRAWTGWSVYDTFNQPWTTWATAGSTPATWELGVANGTYPVVMVCGDAHGIQQRNDFLVEGVAFTDPSPWNGSAANPTTGQLGKFVYLSGTVTVADGKLTVVPSTTAKAPKICFIEIGAVGTALDANFVARATASLSTVNARTTNGRTDAVKPVITLSMFGRYVDDLLGYRVQKSIGTYATKTSYWAHSNHLYSVAAVTSSTGAVVERYSYNAYGVQTVKNGSAAIILDSAIGNQRGFTGYRKDSESGFYYARTRWLGSKVGKWVSRDCAQYIDGYNLYNAYFSPRGVDPFGMCEVYNPNGGVPRMPISQTPIERDPNATYYGPSGPITYSLQPNYIAGTPGVIAGGKYVQLRGGEPTGIIIEPHIEEKSGEDRLVDIVGLLTLFTPVGEGRAAAESFCKTVNKQAQVSSGKFDYLFGDAVGARNAAHNAPRTSQNADQMRRLGLYDDTAGRDLLQHHFDGIVNDPTNVTRSYSSQYGRFEVRESIFAGPSGQFAKFETTWEVLPDGARRLTTVIPFGGR